MHGHTCVNLSLQSDMHKLKEATMGKQDLAVKCTKALGHVAADLQRTKAATRAILKGTHALTTDCMKAVSDVHDAV